MMPVVAFLASLLLLATQDEPQQAPAVQDVPQDQSTATRAAQNFSLDLGSVTADTAVTAPEPSTAPEASPALARTGRAPRSGKAPLTVVSPALFTLDTPIDQLIVDPRAKAVLDKDLPGLSTDENLAKFRTLSLRRLQPLTGGQLTDDLLQQAATDLATIKPVARKGETDR